MVLFIERKDFHFFDITERLANNMVLGDLQSRLTRGGKEKEEKR